MSHFIVHGFTNNTLRKHLVDRLAILIFSFTLLAVLPLPCAWSCQESETSQPRRVEAEEATFRSKQEELEFSKEVRAFEEARIAEIDGLLKDELPGDTILLLERAERYFALKDYESSLRDCNLAIEKKGYMSGDIAVVRGYSEFMLGNDKAALADTKSCLGRAVTSGGGSSLVMLMTIILSKSKDDKIRDTAKAIEYGRFAVQLSMRLEDKVAAQRALAYAYGANGEFELAVEQISSAIKLASQKGKVSLLLKDDLDCYKAKRLPADDRVNADDKGNAAQE